MNSPSRAAGVALLVIGFLSLATGAFLLSQERSGPAAPGGDFTLRSHAGPVSLRDFRGKVVLIHFGYTNCPDVCPVSVAATSQALSAMKPEELARVAAFFISVDPERDTLEKLKDYTAYFHPRMVGLAGTSEETAAVANKYGAAYVRRAPGPDGGYAVDHSIGTYVIAPDGKFHGVLAYGTGTDEVLATVRKLLGGA